MLSSTASEKIVKSIIIKELTTVKDNAEVINFFTEMEKISIVMLFTLEGYNKVKEYISTMNKPHDVIELFYRMKSAIFANEQFFKDVYNVVSTDKMVSVLLEEEYKFLDVKNYEDLKEYYILCVLYAYNNTILD